MSRVKRSPDARIRVPVTVIAERSNKMPSAGWGTRMQLTSNKCVASIRATVVALLAASPLVLAQTTSDDPALDARVRALSAELRCLVCQNQTVADSDSGVARDMRDQVRTQLAAGRSEAEVKTYMTDRFGDFVLYNPPFKATTVVLWAGPFVVLLLAGLLLIRRLRKSSMTHAPAMLSDEDRDRARALLNTKD